MGFDKNAEVIEALEDLDFRYYLQEYYRVNVTDKVIVTEKDLETYYNDGPEYCSRIVCNERM